MYSGMFRGMGTMGCVGEGSKAGKGRERGGLGRKKHGKREGKGGKRHAQSGCWSVCLCGRALCLTTAVRPVFLLNSFFWVGTCLSCMHACARVGLSASTWTGDHGLQCPCTTGEAGVHVPCLSVCVRVWLLVNTKPDSAVDRIRGLGAWYWNGHKSELGTGKTRGFELAAGGSRRSKPRTGETGLGSATGEVLG